MRTKAFCSHLKVLLIQPYVTTSEAIRQYPSEPLGLLYLAYYLNQREMCQGVDVQTQIIDAQLEGGNTSFLTLRGYRSGMTDKQLTQRIQEFKPDIVGVACSYAIYADDALEVSATVKASAACLLVVGGLHATTTHWELIENKSIDVIVRGEGEITFWNLIHCVLKGKSFEKVFGITHKSRGRKRANPDRQRIQNLDRLPIPDRSLINYPEYLRRATNSLALNRPVGR